MEAIAVVLGVLLLMCLVAIGASLVVLCWIFTWDETSRIVRHKKQRRSMNRRLEQMAAADPSLLED